MTPRRRTAALSLAVLALVSARGAHAQAARRGTPAPAAAPAPAPAPRRASWLSDRRDFRVGDVITVVIDEYTLASAGRDNVASDRRRRDARLDVDQGGTTPGTSMGVSTRNDGESTVRSDASRQNRFQGEVSVRVVSVDAATGLLRVQGKKKVDVDKQTQDITLVGFARPEDVTASNTIESFRLADAQLLYKAKGGGVKGGPLSKIVGLLWP
jgi:flagellar L-ring protein precursor FlgH